MSKVTKENAKVKRIQLIIVKKTKTSLFEFAYI